MSLKSFFDYLANEKLKKSLILILKSYLRKIKNKKVRTKAISILCQTNAIEPKEIASPSIAVNPAIKTKK